MKDPGYRVLQSYYNALNGNINVGGVIPVYSVTPKGTEGNRIEIRTITQVNESVKDTYLQDVIVVVDCITEFTSRGSKKTVADIANRVMNRIKTIHGGSGLSITGEGFKFITTNLDNISELDEITDTKKIFRRLLTFTNMVEQTPLILSSDQSTIDQNTLTFRLAAGSIISIDWGNGYTTDLDGNGANDISATSNYTSTGSYDIKIDGEFEDLTVFDINSETNLSVKTTDLPAWNGNSIDFSDCAWTTSQIDNFLINLADGCGASGSVDLSGTNGARSSASNAAINTLTVTNTWTVNVDIGISIMIIETDFIIK